MRDVAVAVVTASLTAAVLYCYLRRRIAALENGRVRQSQGKLAIDNASCDTREPAVEINRRDAPAHAQLAEKHWQLPSLPLVRQHERLVVASPGLASSTVLH